MQSIAKAKPMEAKAQAEKVKKLSFDSPVPHDHVALKKNRQSISFIHGCLLQAAKSAMRRDSSSGTALDSAS